MKQFLIASFSFLLAVSIFQHTAQAQSYSDTIRIYRTTDQYVVTRKAGAKPRILPVSAVDIKANGATMVRVTIDGSGDNYLLKRVLNKANVPYDSVSADNAVNAIIGTLPGAVGKVATSIQDLTSGTNTISTTGVFKVVVRNIGASSATVTYGGFTYTIAAGGSEPFDQERDPKTGLRTPFLALVAIPASSTLRVIKYFEQ